MKNQNYIYINVNTFVYTKLDLSVQVHEKKYSLRRILYNNNVVIRINYTYDI